MEYKINIPDLKSFYLEFGILQQYSTPKKNREMAPLGIINGLGYHQAQVLSKMVRQHAFSPARYGMITRWLSLTTTTK